MKKSNAVIFALGMGMLLVSGCATTSKDMTKAEVQSAYNRGVQVGIQTEKAKIEKVGVEQQQVKAKIVGGVYIPAHKEYVIAKHTIIENSKPKRYKQSTAPQVHSIGTINQTATTFKPTPKLDANAQAKLFESLVNNYNFTEAGNLYRNVISYINIHKIKDKYSYYTALAKYLLVEHDYQNAYDAYIKAYLNATDDNQKLTALDGTITSSSLMNNSKLLFTSLLNLGDFKLNKGDKIGALENYYKALRIKSTPAVNLRIANILKGLGKEQLSKAFTLRAYILGGGGNGK